MGQEIYGGIDYAKIAKKLREELKDREAYETFLIGSDWVSSIRRGTPPYFIKDVADAIYTHDGESILIADSWDVDWGLIEIDRSYRVNWKLGKPTFLTVHSLSYNERDDKVLAFVQYPTSPCWRIIEVQDGKIINGPLSGTALGAFGDQCFTNQSVAYDITDPSTFWVADPYHHVVVKTNWAGQVLKQFGVWNTPGSDLSHLNTPTSVEVIRNGEAIFIADRGNHRVLAIQTADMSVWWEVPYPYPSLRILKPYRLALFYGNTWWFGGDCQPSLIFTDYPLSTRLEFYLPSPSNMISGHPLDRDKVLYAWEQAAFEINLSQAGRLNIPPRKQFLFQETSASANIPIYSPPFMDYFTPNKLICLKASRAGSVEVEVAKFTDTHKGWETYLSESFSENTLKVISIVAPLNVARLKVTLSADGIIDGWVNLSSQ